MLKGLVGESRSYRSYSEENKIREEDLREIIDTARLCPSGKNFQPLKYRLVTNHDEVEELVSLTRWAADLRDIKLPPDGHHPTAFIVMCHDTTVENECINVFLDAGIAAQTIMLAATEMSLGGCIFRSFSPEKVSETLHIPENLKPIIVIALGVPDEMVIVCEPADDGSVKYFRDKANIHFVPKRKLEDIIVE